MLTPRQVLRRLRDLVRGKRLETDVDDEIRFHIEMQTALLVKQGMSQGAARAKAQSDFGIGARVTDHVREARGLSAANVIDDAMRDVRFAARSLVRTPAFSVVSIITLALGIGATTAMFSVVDGVLLRPLPYEHADRLVSVRERVELRGRPSTSLVSWPNFNDWRRQTKTLELMAAFRGGGSTTVLGLAEPIALTLYAVSHDYFKLFGGTPVIGRGFTADESTEGGPPVCVVSYQFWQEQLGARQDLSSVHLQAWGSTFTVIGVMPRGFGFPEVADMWIPLEQQNSGMGRGSRNDETVARVAVGVSREQAETELRGIAARLKVEFPADNAAVGAQVVGLQDALVGPVRTYLRLLLGAVVIVLLVACVNLASANLARGASRSREMTVRTMLGAGRGRLARQLLTENLLLAVVGGLVGVVLAYVLERILLTLIPTSMPRVSEIGLSGSVLAFAMSVTLLTGMLIGLLPAISVGRAELRAGVAIGGRGVATGRGSLRWALVATEVALAVLLLVGAGLLLRSFRALLTVPAGFDSERVLAVNVQLPETRYPNGNLRSVYYTQALGGLEALPGVERVGYINFAPLTRAGFGAGMSIEGHPEIPPQFAEYRIVSPDYFETMRIPLVAGRMITDADDSTSQHVTLINETMAKKLFPAGDALGKQIRNLGMDNHRQIPMTIVGIVGDVRSADLAKSAAPQHFVPYRQRPERARYGVFLLRTKAPPSAVAPLVRSQLRLIDQNVLMTIELVSDIRARSLADRRFTMMVLSGFALLGLTLAAVGIYGVLAYSVARRAREIGIRMALGAAQRRVIRMVMSDSLAPVIAGAVVGIAAALGLTRLMQAMLYGVTATDPITFVVVVVVLLGVAVLASVVPTARAARVDPVVVLREE